MKKVESPKARKGDNGHGNPSGEFKALKSNQDRCMSFYGGHKKTLQWEHGRHKTPKREENSKPKPRNKEPMIITFKRDCSKNLNWEHTEHPTYNGESNSEHGPRNGGPWLELLKELTARVCEHQSHMEKKVRKNWKVQTWNFSNISSPKISR